MSHQTPASTVVSTFGGTRRLARLLGADPSTISRWNAPKAKAGCGGRIPSRWHRRLLDLAREMNVELTANDLVLGRPR